MKDTLPTTLGSFALDAKRKAGTATYAVKVIRRSGVTMIDLVPGKVIRVGRRHENDIVIDHASASRDHAVIYEGDPPAVEDLESKTGTRVQGNAVAPRTRIPLAAGSVVEIADTIFHVCYATETQVSRVGPPGRPDGIVLQDPAMKEVYQLLERVAATPLAVLILGETGVGKELVAERIHLASPRRERPFLRVNCAALTDGILASELFGHERGAFTGAHATKIGLFEAADGGTVFLDEIGELSPETQAKLLRVLESGEVTRVGSHQARHVDVRIISATNRDLQAQIERGKFRADLFFRLNGMSIVIPPLRERQADVVALAEFFAARSAATMHVPPPVLSEKARDALLRHRWPGNVRELKNAIERAVLLSTSPVIESVALRLDASQGATQPGSPRAEVVAHDTPTDAPRLREAHLDAGVEPTPSVRRQKAKNRTEDLRAELARAERDRIVEALRQAGNQAGAAKLLGISRRALIYRLEAYDIPRPRKGAGDKSDT